MIRGCNLERPVLASAALQSEANLLNDIWPGRGKARAWKTGTGLCAGDLGLSGEEMLPLSSCCCVVSLAA